MKEKKIIGSVIFVYTAIHFKQKSKKKKNCYAWLNLKLSVTMTVMILPEFGFEGSGR